MNGSTRIYALHVVLCVFVVGFSLGCRTTQNNGALRAESTVKKTEAVRESIKRSGMTAEQKKQTIKILDEIDSDIRDLGSDVDSNAKDAQKNAVDAARMRKIYWACGIGFLLLLGLSLMKFKSRVIGFFTGST